MPLFHVGSKAQAYAQLWCGGKVIIQRMFDPDLILRTIRDELITHTLLVPTMVQDLLNSPKIDDYDLSSLECLCYAAAPMPVTLLRRTIAKFGKICVDMYGGTEMTLATYLHKHQHVLDGSPEDVKRLGSVGQPTPDVELKIVDDDNRECPPTVAGEILLRSETLMAEYWNNSVATHEAFLDGWYRTGDIGYLDEEGFLFLVDRKKDMIISGGENIYCREVEEALLEYGGLLEAAVIGVPDERWGQTVRAIVVRGRGSDATQEKLVDHCVKIIARYKRPRSIIFVNEMPRLASGKINKVALREAYGSTG
jgi:acyl-CoA synthetase (AMP-forming)/AMP-acid ligase II